MNGVLFAAVNRIILKRATNSSAWTTLLVQQLPRCNVQFSSNNTMYRHTSTSLCRFKVRRGEKKSDGQVLGEVVFLFAS